MPFLIIAVVFVGLLCTLDLILSLGVIRRLREHTRLLSDMGNMAGPSTIAVGEGVGEFTASAADGELLRREHLVENTLVGFFSPNCGPCRETLPKFVEFARTLPGGRDRVLATVVGDADDATAFVAALKPVARVVVEDSGGALSTAFKVNAYPTVVTVAPDGDGRVLVSSNRVDLDRLPVAA